MYYVNLYSPFKFCRTEFSVYHPLHGRHFLTHHLGDCLRLLETLQKVPALLSLYPFSLISLKQATINLSSSYCSCKKSLCASNVKRPKFHRSDENKDQSNWLHWKELVLYTFSFLFNMILHLKFLSQSDMLLTKIHCYSFYRKRQQLARQSRQNLAEQSNDNHDGNFVNCCRKISR